MGLRLSDEAIKVAVAHRLPGWVAKLVNHTRAHVKASERKRAAWIICRTALPDNNNVRRSNLNDIIWRAIERAQIPAVKEPVSLMRDDNKRPDGTYHSPAVARGKPMTWDVS